MGDVNDQEYEPLEQMHGDSIVLPHSWEAEQAVIGACLIDPLGIETAVDEMSGREFYDERNGVIFNAMCVLYDDDEPIDLVTVVTKLQDKQELGKAGGVGYLTEVAGSVPTAANILYYIRRVKDCYYRRTAYLEHTKLAQKALRAENADSVVLDMQKSATNMADMTAAKSEMTLLRDAAMTEFAHLETRFINKSEITGVPSGYPDLDRMTAGFQKSDFMVVGARPSVGKTAFALNIAQNIGIRHGGSVAIFSLEMSTGQLTQRMFSSEANVDASRIRTGRLDGNDWEKLTMAIGNMAEAKIYIDSSPVITVADIRSKSRRLKEKEGLDLILIDYLQLIQGSSRSRRENRQQEVSEISRTLKAIARELDVPVIALSQLSRGVEQRQDKRPMMSDLRESGSLEQDADIVAFLYRDDYYNAETEKKNIIEIILAKQRNGPVGTVELAFLKNINKFVSIDHGHQSNYNPERPTPQGRDWV